MINKIDHIVACLGEECGEVSQLVGKALRFGLFDPNPKTFNTNWASMRQEVHDVVAVYKLLCKEIGIEGDFDQKLIDAKIAKVQKYMILAKEKGQLHNEL